MALDTSNRCAATPLAPRRSRPSLPRRCRRASANSRRAKHPSLAGHARMARRMARARSVLRVRRRPLLPRRRRAGRHRGAAAGGLHAAGGALRASASPKHVGADRARSPDGISDLQFTSALPGAVPVSAAFVRQHLKVGAFVAVVRGRARSPTSTAIGFYDLTGSYGVNVFGYDFYKECIARGAARVRELGPVLGAYHPVVADNVRAPARDLRPGRGVVPHVGHRGRHAGGAAGPLPHAPLAPGPLLRRLPRLVGRRAARRRQSGAGARAPTR